MRIFNTQVYGIDESMIRSGYPMLSEVGEIKYDRTLLMEPHIKRAKRLAKSPIGSGHNNFLKGIIVQMDVEAPQYIWMQIERYQFFTIISSQSKMHKLKEIIKAPCNGSIYDGVKEMLMENETYGDIYSLDSIMTEVPMGLELTAGISTNYMCLRNMYHQRKNHRLEFWTKVFCPWVEGLPRADEFIIHG
jgi:hypothetical protein